MKPDFTWSLTPPYLLNSNQSNVGCQPRLGWLNGPGDGEGLSMPVGLFGRVPPYCVAARSTQACYGSEHSPRICGRYAPRHRVQQPLENSGRKIDSKIPALPITAACRLPSDPARGAHVFKREEALKHDLPQPLGLQTQSRPLHEHELMTEARPKDCSVKPLASQQN